MAVIYTQHFAQFFDNNGNPLSKGKLYTYAAGTTTNKATYTTATGDIEKDNPIILDPNGRTTLFIQGSYRFDLYDSDDKLIKSTDNVSAFTTTPESASSFFQSFSGDGVTTGFTLSTDLGTDENSIMVFIDKGLTEHVTNGTFATDSDWTKGSGWVIGSGVATATTASTALSQTSNPALVEGQSYNITMTITRSAGSLTASIGGTDGTARSASGTYTETIIAGSTQIIAFTGSGFTGTIDDITVTKLQSSGPDVINPNQYTLNGTSLSFAAAPASGTNNIFVFAPSQLVGAASAAAAAAEAAEAGALAAQAAAESAAGLLEVTSTTSVLIGTGSKSFTVAADLSLNAGQFILITSDAAPTTNYMWGQISSYSGTTLQVTVDATMGVGTYADWTMYLTGERGATGATGSISDLSGVPSATPTTSDTLVFTDVDDSNNTKKATTLAVVGATLLDEDNMVSDSATQGATQQSIKAYVDAQTVILTDWVMYTPTFTGLGTPSGVSVWSRRVGDTLQIRGKFTTGTATATEARMTLGFNGTDSNVTSDATKVPSIQRAGGALRSTTGALMDQILIESNIGYITFGYQSSGTAGITKQNGSTIFGTGNTISFNAEIPISGW